MSLPELAVKACAPLLLALVYVQWKGRRYPAAAHLALGLAFASVLVLPFADAALPTWRVAVLPPPPKARPAFPEPVGPPEHPAPVNDLPFVRQVPTVVPDPDPVPSLETACLGLWALGVAAVVLRGLVGGVALWRLGRRGSVPVALSTADALAARVGLGRPWTLRRSLPGGPASALTWGTLRPIVLLPAESIYWPPARLEAVLLHELAHARRGDALAGLVAEAACALHWFNPLAWIAARRMREAAELAADRAVLRCGVPAADYAAELLRLVAEIRPSPRRPLLGAQAMNSPKIESRLRSVLSSDVRGLTARQALLVGAVALAAVPALAAFRPVAVQAGPDRAEALRRAKNLGISTLMYAQDYDEFLPAAPSTARAAYGVLPYARGNARNNRPATPDAQLFQSPTPGGRFLFNTKLAGQPLNQIASPAGTLAWFETLPDPNALVAVAFVDGHAQLVKPARRDALRAMNVRQVAPRRDPRTAIRVLAQTAETRLAAARAQLATAQAEMANALPAVVAERARATSKESRGYRLLQKMGDLHIKMTQLQAKQASIKLSLNSGGLSPNAFRALQLEQQRLRAWQNAIQAQIGMLEWATRP